MLSTKQFIPGVAVNDQLNSEMVTFHLMDEMLPNFLIFILLITCAI
jgi:hypothetical protein